MLDNLGFRITTVVAGLGIGGIALALAAQAILGDLFGYFVILFDRPFEIGDFVVVGDYTGTIERFGIEQRGSPASAASRSSCPTRTSPTRGCATTSGWRSAAWCSGSA